MRLQHFKFIASSSQLTADLNSVVVLCVLTHAQASESRERAVILQLPVGSMTDFLEQDSRSSFYDTHVTLAFYCVKLKAII